MTLTRLKKLLFGNLRRQLMVGMALTMVLMMSFFVWDVIRYQKAMALEQHTLQARALAGSIAASSAVWVVSRDFSGLEEIIRGLSEYPNLRYVMVLDTSGQVLAHSQTTRRGQYVSDFPEVADIRVQQKENYLVDVSSPVMMNDRLIGWVRLGLAGNQLEIWLARMTFSGFVSTLVALVLSLVFAMVASRSLTRRLYVIGKVAHDIQAGRAGLRAEISGSDETAQLAQQFNNMLDTLAQRDQALKDSEAFKKSILDSVAAEVAVLDNKGMIVAVNAHWQHFALENGDEPGQPAHLTGLGSNYLQVCADSMGAGSEGASEAHEGIAAVMEGRLERFSLEYPCHSPQQQRWFTMVAVPLGNAAQNGVAITHTDITLVKRVQLEEEFRSQILEMMTGTVVLLDVLESIVCGVEQFNPSMRCSILLLTDDGQHLGKGVAPSLPDFYNAAIMDAGIQIGMGVGSCGTAAFTGERVIVEDIATHPYWSDYKTLAAQAGLVACWSQPIMSSAGQVSGTFAIYYRESTAPTPQHIVTIEKFAILAGIVIDHKQTQAALKASEDKFRTLFETVPHGVVFQSVDGHITSANPAAQRILGLTMDQLQDQPPTNSDWKIIREDGSLIPGEQHPIKLALKTGQPVKDVMMGVQVPGRDLVWLMVSATPLFRDGLLTQAYAIFEDVTERHQMQLQVQQLAFNDALTQLPNRRLLTDRLHHALTASKRSLCYGALMFLDLDNFKPLNDKCGHDAGDLLLVEVARRLKNCVREVDTVARFGGDEFVVMLVNLDTDKTTSQLQATGVAEKIRIALAEPYEVQTKTGGGGTRPVIHHCTASIGVTLFIHSEDTQDAILHRADAAMYMAKDAGRNTVWFDHKET